MARDDDSSSDMTSEQIARTRRPFLHRLSDYMIDCLLVSGATVSLLWLVWDLVTKAHGALGSIQAVMILFVACLIAIRQQQRWRGPTQHLQELLDRVQLGASPIEELSSVGGELAPLVPTIQRLFRSLRSERKRYTELQDEIRQRLQNRTDALQRTIGSLKRQATQDALTGLYNRRMFDEFLPKAIERCVAEKLDIGLLMIDVDNFKILNDTAGHAAGDELLRDIGGLIRSTVRGTDVAFRLGGDEFVVVMPNSSPMAFLALSHRLTSLMDAMPVKFRVPVPPKLSIGTSQLSELSDPSAASLTQKADDRLYEAKRTGKAVAASMVA
jgi:diguanylate cyclase (GGDEF)-like protein